MPCPNKSLNNTAHATKRSACSCFAKVHSVLSTGRDVPSFRSPLESLLYTAEPSNVRQAYLGRWLGNGQGPHGQRHTSGSCHLTSCWQELWIEDSLDMCVCDVGVYICLAKQTTYGSKYSRKKGTIDQSNHSDMHRDHDSARLWGWECKVAVGYVPYNLE